MEVIKKKILFVCIENSNRSQMAEAFAKIYGNEIIEVYSAGSQPSGKVNEKAIVAMNELNYHNVEFRYGDIENIPVNDNYVNVVVSNCVLNLVPDKKKVFSEIHRILKPGGHFSISDIVIEGQLPANLQSAAEIYAGCISGAIEKQEYLNIIEHAGFKNVLVQKSKPISIPDDILINYLSPAELSLYKTSDTKIISITVYAEKDKSCCDSDCCLN